MKEKIKLGIIICDRYKSCAGGKCFKAMENREGAFERYIGKDIELVGYTSCGGCPGGNIEYAPEEMKKNGAEVIHLATGLIVGYPPCPYITYFKEFIEVRYGLEVIYGTHPIPQKYFDIHNQLKTWSKPEWESILKDTIADERIRIAYN